MKLIHSDLAPKAVGPYSQAILAGGFLFCSGQIPLNPETMQIESEDIKVQTTQVLKNLEAVLSKVELTLQDVVRAEVFLADINDFAEMNEIFSQFFGQHKPARQTFEVSKLPMNSKVEISLIVAYNKEKIDYI